MMFFSSVKTLLVSLTLTVVFPNAGGKLTAEPTKIEVGFHPVLTIKCEFVYSQVSYYDTKKVESLVISFQNSPNQTFEEVAEVSWSLGAQVNPNYNSSNGNLTVDGELSNTGSSFITLVWSNPGESQGGIYICTLNGRNSFREHVVTRNALEIQALKPDALYFARKIRQLQDTTDRLQQDRDQLRESGEQLRQQMNRIEGLYQKSRASMERAASAFFHISGVFKGSPSKVIEERRYFLSKLYIENRIHTAEGLCEAFGGFLAEINDSLEYGFIQSFLKTFSGIRAVYIGGTDAAKENTFVLQHSKTPMGYIDMYHSQPNGGRRQNCVVLYASFGWRMADENCYVGEESYRFLCEVPQP